MEIESEIAVKESKDSVKVNKVNYYLSTKDCDEPSITFKLFLIDPHDLMAAIEKRNKKVKGPSGGNSKENLISSRSQLFHK